MGPPNETSGDIPLTLSGEAERPPASREPTDAAGRPVSARAPHGLPAPVRRAVQIAKGSPASDVEQLALAVLAGDPDAAYALLDEAQARVAQPDRFVPRAELEGRLDELAGRLAAVESRPGPGSLPGDWKVGQRCVIYTPEGGAWGQRSYSDRDGRPPRGVVLAALPNARLVVLFDSGLVGLFWDHEVTTQGPL
jgi:hypothetical protein